jgi:hypothetical protein
MYAKYPPIATACEPNITPSKATAIVADFASGNSSSATHGPIVAMFIISRRTFHRG